MEVIDFWVNFVVRNSNKLQKLGLEGKLSWALNVFTLGANGHATLVMHYIMDGKDMKKKIGREGGP